MSEPGEGGSIPQLFILNSEMNLKFFPILRGPYQQTHIHHTDFFKSFSTRLHATKKVATIFVVQIHWYTPWVTTTPFPIILPCPEEWSPRWDSPIHEISIFMWLYLKVPYTLFTCKIENTFEADFRSLNFSPCCSILDMYRKYSWY